MGVEFIFLLFHKNKSLFFLFVEFFLPYAIFPLFHKNKCVENSNGYMGLVPTMAHHGSSTYLVAVINYGATTYPFLHVKTYDEKSLCLCMFVEFIFLLFHKNKCAGNSNGYMGLVPTILR